MSKSLIRLAEQAHPRYPWVAIWREGGQPKKRFFKAEAPGSRWVRVKRMELEKAAPSDAPISAAERRAIMVARESGVPIGEAVTLWIERAAVRSRSIPVRELIEERLRAVNAEGLSVRHISSVRLGLRRVEEAWGERLACDVATAEVADFVYGRRGAPRTQSHARAPVHALFAFAVDRGWCDENPAAKVKPPKISRVGEIGILKVDEARALLDASGPELRPVIAIGLFAGLRRAEIQRLDWSEVQIERGFIEVSAGKAKTARRRVTASQALCAWLGEGGIGKREGRVWPENFERLFSRALWDCGWRGKKAWIGAKEQAENAKRPKWPDNALRHSFASYHLAHHRDAARTALELGHADTKLLFEHYRELVTPEAAAAFWAVRPEAAGRGKGEGASGEREVVNLVADRGAEKAV